MENRFLCRGKRIDTGEWVEGFYCKWLKGKRVITYSEKETDCIITWMSNGGMSRYEVDPSTICQCTGLSDKNGKLIFENDICDRKEEYPEIVKYNKGDWTLDYSYSKDKESGYCFCNLGFYVLERKCVEVIGNTFDNPELLEV